MARGSVKARLNSTVIHVDATVHVRPAVDAYTEESSKLVDARAAVLTRVRRRALVHVLRTVPTWNSQHIYHYFRFLFNDIFFRVTA